MCPTPRKCAALLTALLLILTLTAGTASAQTTGYYESNGYHVKYYSSSSDVLVIGDSRVCQMYDNLNSLDGYKASYVCTWGANYQGSSNSTSIDKSIYRTEMKEVIGQIKANKGYAKVVIMATINGADGSQWQANQLKNLLTWLNSNVDTQNVQFFVTSIVPGGSFSAANINNTNIYIKNMVANLAQTYPPMNVTYKDIGTLPSSAYLSDNTHLTTAGIQQYYHKIAKNNNCIW